MRALIAWCAVAAGLAATTTWADSAVIPFSPKVRVYKPQERAVIAWNGQDEVLIVTADLYAAEDTKVLEVLPLPAKPRIKIGDLDVFGKVIGLVGGRVTTEKVQGKLYGEEEKKDLAEAVSIEFLQRVTPQDLTTVELKTVEAFEEWTLKFLRDHGAAEPELPAKLRKDLPGCLAAGCTWFVFNVVPVETRTRTRDAIEVAFATDQLFYPLRLERTMRGDTTVRLFVITDGLVKTCHGIARGKISLMNEPVVISTLSLRTVNAAFFELLQKKPRVDLRIWQLENGGFFKFSQDLLVD